MHDLTRRHLRFGWWSLFVFLCLGVLLEALHGYRVPDYLAPEHETRRLLWTLAHAHGALLSLVHVAFAVTADRVEGLGAASPALLAASVMLPSGFFLGGLFEHGADPGIGILLVPLGALPLAFSVVVTARAIGRD